MKARAIVLGALVLSAHSAAHAQVQRSGGDATARVMQQLQQVTAEKTSLQAENTRLQKELEKLQGDLKQATAGRAALEAKTRNMQALEQRSAAAAESQEQLEKTRGQLQELVAKFRETAQSLRDVETDRAQVKTQLGARERDFKTCVDRNVEFYDLNNEILTKLEDRGFLSSFASVEPFTRIARTRLENLIDDYRYRAEELKAEKAKKTALSPQE